MDKSYRRIARSLVMILFLSLFQFGFTYQNSPVASAASFGTPACSSDFSNTTNLVQVTLANYCVIRITSGSTTWTPPTGIQNLYVLAVGGGGGGGNNVGGGGAGGAVAHGHFALGATTNVSISVGSGGAGGRNDGTSPIDGQAGVASTVVANTSVMSLTAAGGNGGETYWPNNVCIGSGTTPGAASGGAVTSSGSYVTISNSSGATGGVHNGGAGAAGSSRNITGTAVTYGASGGGGGWDKAGGTGGTGGGGTGGDGVSNSEGVAGTANTGSGGGGGSDNCGSGGAGGSGVVILRWIPVPVVATPVNASSLVNRNATFTTTVTSTTTLTQAQQWSFSSNAGATYSNVTTGTGGTSLTHVTAPNSSGNSGFLYRLGTTFSDATISSIGFSTSATLTVSTPPGSDTDTALSLNGTSQFADVADTTGSAFDMTGTFTLQAWVKPANACPGQGAVISKNVSYMLYCQAGVWKVMALATGTNGTGNPTSISVEPNEWHHIAITKISNSGNILFYYDGVLVQTIATGVTTMAPNNNPFQIGQYTSSYFFNGQIDQVHVYNTQRTQTQIAADMNAYGLITDSALMAYYDFNEGSGVSTLYNRKSGATSATDLTIRNSPTFTDVKIDSISGAYTVVEFPRTYITSTGGWRVPSAVTRVHYLVVAGGGAGGGSINPSHYAGGGGGGGGVRTAAVPINSNYLSPVVGMGQFAIGCALGRGQNSSLSGSGFTSISATGGGSGSCNVNTGDGAGGIVGNSGGSGGGGGAQTYARVPGTGNLGGFSPAEGFIGGAARADGSNGDRQAGGGGGGAAEQGGAATAQPTGVATAGNGGAGLLSTILDGTNHHYGGGGGGGSRGGAIVGTGGLGGGGTGGAGTNGQGTEGTAGTGGGGGGNSRATANNGGSGVIIIRFITATAPIFTQPLIDTTTAGLTDTITVSANPISPLTRNFQWQSSTDTGTTWSNIASNSGSGALTNTYTTPILETTTSGARFQYRVIVTDSDTAGLFIVDTSVAVFIVVNPRITFSGTFTPQKYGEGDSDTFTVLNGTGNKTVVRTSSNRAGVSWNFNTLNTAVVNVAPTVSVGTYLETITATDTRGAQTQLVISVVVTRADTITVTALARSDTFTGSALTFTPSFTVTGLKNSDTVTPVIYNFSGADNAGANYASSTTRPINAGSYIITPSVPASLTDSYTAVTIVTGALTINRATRTLSVIAPASPLKYGETRTITSTLSAGAGDGALTYLTSTPDSCTVSSTTVQAVRASGSCSFTAQITRGNNFETATASAATTTLARADTITVQLRNPVTLTYTANPAASLPTQTIIGLVHTDAATTSRLYSHPASAVGAPESYAALTNSAAVPTDVETYTVSSSTLAFSSGLASNYVNIIYETSTLIINQANQQPLRIAMYGAYIGSSYSIITDGGSGGGVVIESTTAGSTAANCVINTRVLTTTSTVQSVCNILVTKGASRNFKVETTTAQITFYLFIPVVSVPVASGGPTIGITGENTVTIDAVGAPTITSLSSTTISLGAGGSITITGTGFGSSALTVKFWRDKAVTVTPTNSTTITVSVADIAAAGGTSGRISVITVGGLGVSVDRLTINP